MKTVKGFQYSVTANEEVTITDDNGLNLTCPAGQQTYFVATGDEVDVAGDGVVTQTRGGIIAGGGGGGGGGEKINPGEVVLGGTQGSVFITQLNECTRCPMFITGDLPEGVTFEQLEDVMIEGAQDYKLTTYSGSYNAAYYVFQTTDAHPYGSIFAKSPITTLPSTVNFANLKLAKYGFYNCTDLTSFDVDMPALTNGYYMFYGCTKMARFESDLSSLADGSYMFYICTSLTSFDVDMPALTNGYYMFYTCNKMTSWDVDLPSLTNGERMFYNCTSLTTFEGDLSSLPSGAQMFNNCNKMARFESDLSSLTSSANMFYGCTSLTSFESALPALTNGIYMFEHCKLDLASVNRIVNSVPSYTSGSHPIYIGVDSSQVTQEQQNAANTILVGKGWTVTWQRN